ncbi:hypothetical protein AVEN_159047-1 [Araneus ventricosus]|uniref:Uncharacterized protein n=1 Tax=Araneus ventricosus TaxID=182803 RepID=A0A4Y2H4A6_ARAVE|nr:hypothetical protein AVEN_159047-1 [Araneus ventricosus]
MTVTFFADGTVLNFLWEETRGVFMTLMLSSSRVSHDALTFVPCNDTVQEKKPSALCRIKCWRYNPIRVAYYTSHFNRRPCVRQRHHLLTDISESCDTTISIYRWRLITVIVYSI